MVAKYHTINEERGARRAAELRKRFRHVSNASIDGPKFGNWAASKSRSFSGRRSRQTHGNEFLIWCILGVIVVFIGSVIF